MNAMAEWYRGIAEEALEIAEHGDYRNGNTDEGGVVIDEGEAGVNGLLDNLRRRMQSPPDSRIVKAWLCRDLDPDSPYLVSDCKPEWIEETQFWHAGGWFEVLESDVPPSLRLPPGGGPVEVEVRVEAVHERG